MKKQLLVAAFAALTLGNALNAGPIFNNVLENGNNDNKQIAASLLLGLYASTLLDENENADWVTRASNALGRALNAFNYIAVQQNRGVKIKGLVQEIVDAGMPAGDIKAFYAQIYNKLPENKRVAYGTDTELPNPAAL